MPLQLTTLSAAVLSLFKRFKLPIDIIILWICCTFHCIKGYCRDPMQHFVTSRFITTHTNKVDRSIPRMSLRQNV